MAVAGVVGEARGVDSVISSLDIFGRLSSLKTIIGASASKV